jgi:hypothetical protein
MKIVRLAGIIAFLALLTMACTLFSGVSNLVAGPKGNSVSDLWPDVPRMDGLTKIAIDIPLPVRVAFQGLLKASNQDVKSLDFITFESTGTAQQVVDFYSLEKMQAAGWNLSDGGCQGYTPSGGSEDGAICFFAKQTDPQTAVYLLIFIGKDNQTSHTQVYFARSDVKATPEPSQGAN